MPLHGSIDFRIRQGRQGTFRNAGRIGQPNHVLVAAPSERVVHRPTFGIIPRLPSGKALVNHVSARLFSHGCVRAMPASVLGSDLVLQLSLLVDQEFGGLSFPVAGFGDGLMEPAPGRPSENEVDADAQLEAGDEAADLGHAEGNECARSLAPFWPARLTRIAARKASASIDRVTWRYQPCQYQPCQLRTS